MIRSLVSMMTAAALCIVAMPLASCGPKILETGASTAPAEQLTPLERAERAWARVRGIAVIATIALPAPWDGYLQTWIARGDVAMARARSAADGEAQVDALREVEAAVAAIAPATARPRAPGS